MKIDIVNKFIQITLAIGLILWIGGNVVRYAIAYDLFVPGTELTLKNWYSPEIQLNIVSIFRIASFYTFSGYCLTIISTIILIIINKSKFKNNGWMLISSILILLTLPIESILAYFDIKIMSGFNNLEIKSFDSEIIKTYFLGRLKHWFIPGSLSFLSGMSAVIIAVWKPLVKK